MNDNEVMRVLIGQVSKAVPRGGSERDVTTIITRPMWRAWCRAIGIPCECKPCAWGSASNHNRVFGSRTLVVDNPKMLAVSGVLASTAKYLPK